MTVWVDDSNAALLMDLYELTMADGYHRASMNEPATFDLFARSLPPDRAFLVSCGLADALDYLETMRFGEDHLSYLASLGMFSDGFLDYLGSFSFGGEVWAVPEGCLAFAHEPLLRVTAPLIEAQMVETFLLNCVGFQTMVASKAARVSLACGDREFVDFSPRRDHGADAALKAARASYTGGAAATSNVLAGSVYGIPVSGTMAHSFVMAFEEEMDAFRKFARDFPNDAVLLIDTFDTLRGARRAAEVGAELRAAGHSLAGVRLDSGDVASLAVKVRSILDEAGLTDTRIVVSGDMDEFRIEELLRTGAPVDAFGVGTQLGTSGDAPTLGCVYKLVADTGGPKMKLSQDKVTLPGCKQIHRFTEDGLYSHDVIALEDEEPGGEPVMVRVMEGGRATGPPDELDTIRKRCRASLERLPEPLRALHPQDSYDVRTTRLLDRLVEEMRERPH